MHDDPVEVQVSKDSYEHLLSQQLSSTRCDTRLGLDSGGGTDRNQVSARRSSTLPKVNVGRPVELEASVVVCLV